MSISAPRARRVSKIVFRRAPASRTGHYLSNETKTNESFLRFLLLRHRKRWAERRGRGRGRKSFQNIKEENWREDVEHEEAGGLAPPPRGVSTRRCDASASSRRTRRTLKAPISPIGAPEYFSPRGETLAAFHPSVYFKRER